jgi:hypothetical protein
MGAVAGNGPTIDQVAEYIPQGRYLALPDYTASIMESTENEGFLEYAYRLMLNVNEAMDTPPEDLLGLAPGQLGLTIEAGADITLDGFTKQIGFAIDGTMSADNIDISEYAPPFLAPFDPSLSIVEPSGFVRTEAKRTFPGGGPYEFELVHKMDAGVGFAGELNLKPITGKLPYIGPVLTTLDKTDGFRIFGDLDARVDLITTRTWRSLFPEEPTSILPDTRTPRKHFLGGQEEISPSPNNPENQFDLAFNFGVGLRASVAGDRLGARGGLRLAGDPHPRTDRPSLVVSLNPDGDWPPIKRVHGKALAELTAHLDAWITRFEKSWEWELAAFDLQLSTDATFELVPMTLTDRTISFATAPSAEFVSEPITLLNNFFPLAARGKIGNGSFFYTDPDGAGDMALRMLPVAGDGTFQEPITIATTHAMVAADVVQLPSGAFLAAWSEIPSGQSSSLFPSSEVYYAVSDVSGANWGTPMLFDSFAGVVGQVELLRTSGFVGLLAFESLDGPIGGRFEVWRSVYNGTWSPPATTYSGLELVGADVLGASQTNLAFFAYSNPTGGLYVAEWDGNTFGTATLTCDDALGDLALTETADGDILLGYALNSGGLGLKSLTPGGGMIELPSIVGGGPVSGIAASSLTDGITYAYPLAWVEGGEVTRIRAAMVDASGALLQGPTMITNNTMGTYEDLVVLPEIGLTARVIATYRLGETQIREFLFSHAAGIETDRDGDGYADQEELALIDADPNDAVSKLSQVLPTGDFDMDGASNRNETFVGTDGADATSRLSLNEISFPDGILFRSAFGIDYDVQYRQDLLSPGDWMTLYSVTGDGRLLRLPLLPDPEGFYRLHVDVP